MRVDPMTFAKILQDLLSFPGVGICLERCPGNKARKAETRAREKQSLDFMQMIQILNLLLPKWELFFELSCYMKR